jgi:hypothetical protein
VFIPTTVLNGQVLFAIFARVDFIRQEKNIRDEIVVTQHVLVNFAMSEGTSEASAAKKRKLGQRFRPEYSSLAL